MIEKQQHTYFMRQRDDFTAYLFVFSRKVVKVPLNSSKVRKIDFLRRVVARLCVSINKNKDSLSIYIETTVAAFLRDISRDTRKMASRRDTFLRFL
jgi:hypothetical protein